MTFRLMAFLYVLVAGALTVSGQVAMAQELITDYHSDIQIAADSSMVVSESISVVAQGDAIRRGIFRDFPTTYSDRFGNAYRVEFDVLSVLRDGRAEPWRTERRGNGVRVYVGDADVLLEPGEYTYTLQYRTDRQIGFFDDHDELYWNVTGNGWDFVIEQASARVTLPEAVPATALVMEGYTGPMGAEGGDYRAAVTNGGGTIETTSPLAGREGLTLVLSFPKGVLTEPSSSQKAAHLLSDNLSLLLSLLTLVGVAAYLYTIWSRHGKDPAKGVIFPHYDAPADFSPASVRYITRMGYDNKTFTAAIINLAVKGYLTIAQDKKDYMLQRKESSAPLAPGEQVLLDRLFSKGAVVELKNENHSLIGKARSAHRKSLRRDYLGTYFKTNLRYMIAPFVLSMAMLAVIGLLGDMVVVAAIVFGIIFALQAIFAFLMRAPSPQGRALMDKLEGFKLFLDVAEKDDLNLRHPPDLTPELFERFLPFAVALGVEQAWAEKFTSVFAALEAKTGAAYHPVWYHGAFHHRDLNGFTNNVSRGFSSAISSAATPPGSSSGSGGGGSSGGGGGGGGGGGW